VSFVIHNKQLSTILKFVEMKWWVAGSPWIGGTTVLLARGINYVSRGLELSAPQRVGD
jgi:hypothetical protein